jgi:protein-tyrosine phosphatase
MRNILVVCIGNICRSPMAEALLKRALPAVTIRSAGIGALIGHPADPFAIQILSQEEIDILPHRAQQISRSLVAEADLILVMDTDQKRVIEERYLNARGKVFRLCESENLNIPDPYMRGFEAFQKSFELINSGVQFWVAQIAKL